MRSLLSTPLDQLVNERWNAIGAGYRKAFLWVVGINLLAFGFEMTNLTIHHDDVIQFFIQNDQFQADLGRFGSGWLHYYTQGAYIMPFLQMLQGILFMSLYGMVVAHLWGARKTLDMVLIAGILCVFPYMAQMFQYNSSMAIYSLAHLLAALAVLYSVRAKPVYLLLAALLYAAAFSIYQTVVANAATIFLVWALSRVLFGEGQGNPWRELSASSAGALLAVAVGGGLYLAAISVMNIHIDNYQGADQALSLSEGLQLELALPKLIQNTRSFYFWPEHYLPGFLKNLQLLLLVAAVAGCLWLPKGWGNKIGALVVFALAALLAPQLLQLLHPHGWFHNLTLTAYAVTIAGAAMILFRAGSVALRNGSILVVLLLIGGYIINCNWISTVNYLNTLAHYATLTQVLAQVRAQSDSEWDGKTIAVAGKYRMRTSFPFKRTTGVASEYMDARHMQRLAWLMREDVSIVPADEKTPAALKYAQNHPPWPHPGSVGVVDGMGVVVFGKERNRN